MPLFPQPVWLIAKSERMHRSQIETSPHSNCGCVVTAASG
jgi:hypothetical protein